MRYSRRSRRFTRPRVEPGFDADGGRGVFADYLLSWFRRRLSRSRPVLPVEPAPSRILPSDQLRGAYRHDYPGRRHFPLGRTCGGGGLARGTPHYFYRNGFASCRLTRRPERAARQDGARDGPDEASRSAAYRHRHGGWLGSKWLSPIGRTRYDRHLAGQGQAPSGAAVALFAPGSAAVAGLGLVAPGAGAARYLF